MSAQSSTTTEKARLKKKDARSCRKCLQQNKQQRLLYCLHSFCEDCLQSLVKNEQQSLTCPTCHKVTTLPEDGVAGLQQDCQQNDILEKTETKGKCSKHPDKDIELYCETCDQLICSQCLICDHRTHDFDLIPASFDKQEKLILNSLKPVENQMELLEAALKSARDESDAVTQQEKTVVEEIHTAFKHIRKVVDEREEELVEQAKRTVNKKLKILTDQCNQFEQQLTEMRSCRDSVDKTRRTCNQMEFLHMKTQLLKQVEENTRMIKPRSLLPADQANIKFSNNIIISELEKAAKLFGKIFCSVVSPDKCKVIGNGLKIAIRGEDTVISIEVLDREWKPCPGPVHSLKCELVLTNGSSRVRGTVKLKYQHMYNISYQPTTTGEYQLHILIEEQHILNSPFSVTVIPNFTAPARVIKPITNPRGIAVMEEGKVVVARSGSNRLSTVRIGGRIILSPSLHLKEPEGVAITAAGDIIVVDRGKSCIVKYSPDGTQHITSAEPGTEPLQFNSPVGIAIHHLSSKVYVADTGNHRIQILNSDLTYSSSFGKKGSGNGEFNHPCDIAIDRDGLVYVADRDNNRIQVFTSSGKYIRQFGRGEREVILGGGKLSEPVRIAISSNIVYVAENGELRISIFFTNGDFITSLGIYSSTQTISGLTTDKRGTVYVSDAGNNSIQIFK